jgi:hypothetical protein
MTRSLIFLVTVSLSISACKDEGTGLLRGVIVVTDKLAYQAGEQIGLKVLNDGDATVHLPTCCSTLSLYIDRADSGGWRQYQARGFPCLALCPVVDLRLDAGQAHQDSLRLVASGTYRVRLLYGQTIEFTAPRESTSNAFTIQ